MIPELLADASRVPAELGDRLRGALVDRVAVAEERAGRLRFASFHTLVRLGHVGGVLWIGTGELVADIVHGVAQDEQRPGRDQYAYVTQACDRASAITRRPNTSSSSPTALSGRGDLICAMSARRSLSP